MGDAREPVGLLIPDEQAPDQSITKEDFSKPPKFAVDGDDDTLFKSERIK